MKFLSEFQGVNNNCMLMQCNCKINNGYILIYIGIIFKKIFQNDPCLLFKAALDNILDTDSIIYRIMCVLMYCQYEKTLLWTDRKTG